MSSETVKINLVKLIVGFASALDSSKGIHKIMDEHGYVEVPIDKFNHFSHDLGIMLARVILSIVEPGEESE